MGKSAAIPLVERRFWEVLLTTVPWSPVATFGAALTTLVAPAIVEITQLRTKAWRTSIAATRGCSATLEDRGLLPAKPDSPLRLQEPKPVRGEIRRTGLCWEDVDQAHTPWVTVDRLNDASHYLFKCLAAKGAIEVSDGEIVWNPEVPHVGDDDLDVPAAVLVFPRGHSGASGLGQDGGDLDAYDPAEGPFCCLMDNSTFSTSEVHKGVAIRDPEVAERPGEHIPLRWHVVHSVGMVVLGFEGVARGIEPAVQHVACELFRPAAHA